MNMFVEGARFTESQLSSEPLQTIQVPANTVAAFSGSTIRRILQMPRLVWQSQALAELEVLLRLERGWDGYKAGPVSLPNVVFSLKILESICNQNTLKPQFIPGTDGDIQMEWHTGVMDLEIHVHAPNDVDVWFRDDKTDEQGQEFHLTNDFRLLIE